MIIIDRALVLDSSLCKLGAIIS